MSPYDPDSRFSMSALCRLENKGIPVLTALETLHRELVETAMVNFTEAAQNEYRKTQNPSDSVEIVIRQWTLGDSPGLTPTWRSLHQVLRQLGLEELSQQIEEFLCSEL